MTEDMSEFLGVFLEEAREQLEQLEQDFLNLEREATPELLQRIFRAAHTLKGSSRAMGFVSMGELTHAMEDVLDGLRQNTLAISPSLIDALFQALDSLKQQTGEIAETGNSERDTTKETEALRNALQGEAPSSVTDTSSQTPIEINRDWALTPEQCGAAEEAQGAGLSLYRLRLTLATDCLMKSIRVLMALQALEAIGSVLALNPSEEAIEQETFELDVEILFATEKEREPAQIQSAVLQVSEIAGVHLEAWQNSAKIVEPLPPVVLIPEPEVEQKQSEPKTGEAKAVNKQAQTIRVDVARLDNLLNLVGELVIDRTRLTQLGTRLGEILKHQPLMEQLSETAAHIGRITDELQEEIMKARMLPVESVFNRFPRMVRDLAQKLNKEVELIIEGGETELDRSVIEVISDPLIHMIRNSVDHGIELPADRMQVGKPMQGTVWVRARHEESHVVIEIEDNGKGIDPQRLRDKAVQMGTLSAEGAGRLNDTEALQLIFASGFSTAKVVSEVSGRGVGMDIVRSNLEKLGGTVSIESRVGEGSRFTVKLPLTLAIIRALLVGVYESVYAIPLGSVVETLKIEASRIHLINHREVILQRGRTLPIIRMADVFPSRIGTTPAEKSLLVEPQTERAAQEEMYYLVTVGFGERQVGLLVDHLIGEQEIVIKSLGRFLGDIRGISGATILGDGRVGLIVDINGVIQFSTETQSALSH
jgi:two-component system chemotaxis sensor kinase CheA